MIAAGTESVVKSNDGAASGHRTLKPGGEAAPAR